MDRRFFLRLAALTAATKLVEWRFAGAAPAKGPSDGLDAVVVGAGLGGLCCAAHLARNGFRTLVLEQHHRVGGYASSFPRQAGGRAFQCEVSLHATALGAPETRSMLEELGVWDRLELVPHTRAWSSRFPGFSLDVPARAGLDGFERQLAGLFPDEAPALRAYFDLWRGVLRDLEALGKARGFDRQEFPRLFPDLWSIRDKTLGQVLDAHALGSRTRAVLAQSCGYYGLPPSRLSAFYYLVATGGYLENGGYYVKGTSQALSDALARAVTEAGGEVRTRTAVSSILVRDGRAVGVRTADGAEFPARAVVCNASAPQVFGGLLPPDSLPGPERARLDALAPSPGSFIVWLGLDRDVSRSFPEAELNFYTGEDMEAGHAASVASDFERCGFALMVYDSLVPGFSPPGCSTLTLVTLSGMEHWAPFEADYLAGRKQAYAAEKKRLADVLVRRAEELALPGLSRMIVMRECSTPLTNIRFTRNAFGSIYGYACTADNAFLSRIPNRTGIKGLYLASAWGNPGGGYTGVLLGGKKAFRDAAEDLAGS